MSSYAFCLAVPGSVRATKYSVGGGIEIKVSSFGSSVKASIYATVRSDVFDSTTSPTPSVKEMLAQNLFRLGMSGDEEVCKNLAKL